MKQKIFCIGLPKTGTNSLTVALEKLGYKTIHCPDIDRVILNAKKADALTDGTVIPYMEALDRLWPDAKSILTVRDEERWLDSCRRHYSVRLPPDEVLGIHRWNRRAIYGRDSYDEEAFRKVLHDHINHIIDYFKDRSEKILIFNICAGEGYEKLCPFLELPVLEEEFPHRNRDKIWE